jgi:Ca2+-binding RTX toxin-like protein
MALLPIPADILAAPSSLHGELLNNIQSLIDASQPATIPGENNDRITGPAAANVINGLSGNHVIASRDGNDTVFGGIDNDFLEGGANADVLSGGLGDDVYFYASRFHGNDVIRDFESSQDKFSLSGLGFGVDPGTNPNDGTTFIAAADPFAIVAQATVLYETDTGRVLFDFDCTGVQAVVQLATITGAPQLTNQDFEFV